jgi:aspartyl-tRNA(Asn)/glutamyl-tRNA(Gln) amidotransferase subunit A
MHDDVRKTVLAAIYDLKKLGAEIVEVSLPHTDAAVACYYIIAPAEASSNLARYDGIRYGHRAKDAKNLYDLYCRSRSEGFGAEVKRRIMVGTYVLSTGYYDAYYLKAQKVRSLIARDFEEAFSKVDVIVSPATPTTAFSIGEKVTDPLSMYLNDIFTIPVNLAGLPGMTIPCGFDSSGLPIGLQLIGKAWDESTLFNVAATYEETHQWHVRQPTMEGL